MIRHLEFWRLIGSDFGHVFGGKTADAKTITPAEPPRIGDYHGHCPLNTMRSAEANFSADSYICPESINFILAYRASHSLNATFEHAKKIRSALATCFQPCEFLRANCDVVSHSSPPTLSRAHNWHTACRGG